LKLGARFYPDTLYT